MAWLHRRPSKWFPCLPFKHIQRRRVWWGKQVIFFLFAVYNYLVNCLFFSTFCCHRCLLTPQISTSNIYCLFCCLTVNKYAKEFIAPCVSKMDENSAMDKEVIQSLFEQGVCTALVLFKSGLLSFLSSDSDVVFVTAYGNWGWPNVWRHWLHILFHHSGDRGTGEGGSICGSTLWHSEHIDQHAVWQSGYARSERALPQSAVNWHGKKLGPHPWVE